MLKLFKRGDIISIKDRVKHLQEYSYFEYFTYFGFAYFITTLLSYIKKRNKKIISSEYIKSKGWIVFADGCQDYVCDICVGFLDFKTELKVLLVGDNEQLLKENKEKILGFKSDVKFKVEMLLYNISTLNVIELEHRFNNIILTNQVSILILNSNYAKFGYFDTFSTSDIKLTYVKNVQVNDYLLQYAISKKNKTLVFNLGSLISKLKLPYLQLYSSCKLAFRHKVLKIAHSNITNLSIVHLEDFEDIRDKTDLSLIKSYTQGSTFLTVNNQFCIWVVQSNCLISYISKKIILNSLTNKSLYNNR